MAATNESSATEKLYLLADELRSTAQWGLRFSGNDYDKERYQRVLEASARLTAVLDGKEDFQGVSNRFEDNLNRLTPFAGAEGAVFHEGKLLLIRRADNRLWAVPGGSVEVGETAAQAAQRELKEEAGLDGKPVRLLGVFDSYLWGSQIKAHIFHFVFEMEAENLAMKPGPEALEAGFFGESEIPSLTPGHAQRVPVLFQLWRGEKTVPYIDGV